MIHGSSKSASGEDRHRANAHEGDADLPKRDQNELKFARVTNIVTRAQPNKMHRYVGSEQQNTDDKTNTPKPD
jgi:hypothetical protein